MAVTAIETELPCMEPMTVGDRLLGAVTHLQMFRREVKPNRRRDDAPTEDGGQCQYERQVVQSAWEDLHDAFVSS
jgi:hypothetical protein